MEPKFEAVVPLLPSDPAPGRITDIMGIDYHGYIQCRITDSKTISYLIGKSTDKMSQHSVEWGRSVMDSGHHERPRIERTSRLYPPGSRKSALPAKDAARPWQHEKKHSGLAAYECGEEDLKNDLYLSPSDDEEPPGLNCTPNNSQRTAQESQISEISVSKSGPTSTGIRDLSYWVKKGSEKCEKKTQPPNESQTSAPERKPRRVEEKTSTTPKSMESGTENYRELVKNGIDSLSSSAPALRSGRMLSVLNDTDDEGPAERKEWQPPALTSAKSAKTYREWKRASRLQERPTNSFVDRKVLEVSPKREIIGYGDLNNADSDGSPEELEDVKPKEISKVQPPIFGGAQSSENTSHKRKSEKAHSKNVLTKADSLEKRLRPMKTEVKTEVKSESVEERFRFERRPTPFHIAFPVPSHTASPSHRKRPRRHNERDVSDVPESQKIPLKKHPVHSQHSSPDSDLPPDALTTTGGFDMASPQSPATDPMVDPNFERNLSDFESDHEPSPLHRPPPHRPARTHSPAPALKEETDPSPHPPIANHKSHRAGGAEPEPDKHLSPQPRSAHRLPSLSPARGERSQGHGTHDANSSELRSTLIKAEAEKKPSIFHALPKIPRKRRTSEEMNDSKKKARVAFESSPIKPEEIPQRDATKQKESKKNRHKPRKSKEPELVKREPSSPRGGFEMSVTDEPQVIGLSVSGPESLAPTLPRVSNAAEFTERATQCELMPATDRDTSETKDTKRQFAVAFRIAGGRGGNISSAEARAAASSGAGEAGGSAMMRRASTASTLEDGEPSRAGLNEESEDRAAQRAQAGPSDHLDAVMRHKQMQETLVKRENVAYQKMNAHACFSDALDKKVEADRLKSDGPARFALCALRACYLYIQACYVEERQNKSESASIHYREAVAYVRSTSQLIEQVAKSAAQSEPNSHRARVRHNFITLLCAQMKAIINYRIYCIAHRETARLRPEIERELHRIGANGNGASERSTPESITRSPAIPGGGGLHLSGESLHRLQRYFRNSRVVQLAHEYWMHAMTLRQKHEELASLEELVFRKSQVICYGPECPVPCFLRYLNTFLTLYEEGEV